jgi:peptidoglycan/xylan/chitin deacetylase (PgdA/CDA1 family)
LTFDDGPSTRLTPAILNLLAENNAKATFFILGRNIAGREEIIRQIAEQGHEIGSHGYDHLHYWKVSPMRSIRDIKRGWQTIDAALGVEHRRYIFRPPNGRLNLICLLYLLAHQIPIIYWSVDSGDTWAKQPAPQIIALLAKKAGGAVSLAHDFERSDDGEERQVLEALSDVLRMAKTEGMRILKVSELLGDKR